MNRISLCFQVLQPCVSDPLSLQLQTRYANPNFSPSFWAFLVTSPSSLDSRASKQILSPQGVYTAPRIIFSQWSVSALFLQSPSCHKPGLETCQLQKADKKSPLLETRYKNTHILACKMPCLLHCTFSSTVLTWNANHYILYLITQSGKLYFG